MTEAREKIEKQKRKIEDLVVLVLAKAAVYGKNPHDDVVKLRTASEHMQAAAQSLFMAQVCLMED